MKTDEGVETLAIYEEGATAIVYTPYSYGKVVVFSSHPEASLEAGVDPEEAGTLRLLGNAITFASRSEGQR